MKRVLSFLVLGVILLSTSCARAQSYSSDKPAYVIYDAKGKKVSYSDMLKAMSNVDVCLFGEYHNDPISHWLELEMAKDLHKIKKEKFVMGAEMWETDQQVALDEFLKDDEADISSYASQNKLWPNFSTDYMPLLSYAKGNDIKFIATNVPRRYASIVSRKGVQELDSLSAEGKKFLPPLPIHIDLNNEFYRGIAQIFTGGGHMTMRKTDASNFVRAQAVKDATMAYFILKNMKEGDLFFHFHGELHSAFNSAIQYYLEHYKPEIKVKTISMIKQKDIMKFDAKNSRADFNIVIPEGMSTTYVQ